MSHNTDPRLLELVVRYEELEQQGRMLSPEEFCQESPELLEPFKRELAALRRAEHVLRDSTTSAKETALPGYDLHEVIGRGGMGVVYRARDQQFDRDVAVKLLADDVPANSPPAARFLVEAKITGQLQHPGIPAVHELGTLADGRPFLAMKLVKGQTLQTLLDGRPNPQHDRGRFLAIFEHICHAVGYAHAHRVIHRDLKPSNVMVGAHGEVQVMDWGLAKVVSDPSPPREQGGDEDPWKTVDAKTAIDTPRGSGSETRTGSVLGTPAYMPPEQAGGEIRKLDARTDVFALGAILCQILTGRPPYAGKDANENKLLAIRGDLQNVFSLLDVSAAEPDLLALCKRCLAFRQEDRPVDAGEVANAVGALRAAANERARQAELERARAEVHATEQRRRRRTVQVAASLIATVLLLGLGISLWQVLRAINAEQKAVSEGEVKGKALQAAFKALRTMTDEVIERKFSQGQSQTLTDEDRAFLRSVIEQYEAFAAIQGDDLESRAVLAGGRLRIARIQQALSELKEAEANYDVALGIFKQLVVDFPDSPDFRWGLAGCYNSRGLLMYETGRLQEAEKDYSTALTLFQQLAIDLPSEPMFRLGLANGLNNRGILLHATARLREAEQDYNQLLAIKKQLVTDFPTRPEFRDDLSRSYKNRAMLLIDKGRLVEAERDYDQAVVLFGQLAADFPNRPEYRDYLAGSHNGRGELLRATGRLQEAEADYDTALAIEKRLAADFPTRPEFRRVIAQSQNNQGILQRDTGRQHEAEANLDSALAIFRQLAADFPMRPEFHQELALSHNNRGSLLRATGRKTEAEAEYDAALAIQLQLAADFLTRPQFHRELALTHNNRGNLLSDTGRKKEAEAEYDAALAIQLRLVADCPNRCQFRQDLARSHNLRGILLWRTGRLKEAEADYDAALRIEKLLAADFPSQPEHRNAMAGICVNLALLHRQRGELTSARRLLFEGRPHHLAALEVSPTNSTYRQFYRNHLSLLTEVYAGLLQPDDAVRTGETNRDLGWDPPSDAYDAACFLSLCIPIVSKHDKLDKKQRTEAAQFYADEAMKMLRDAVSKGFKDTAHMKQDKDLDPLREREDFKKLLAEVEGKAGEKK
jgi:serine/threonine protein kinase